MNHSTDAVAYMFGHRWVSEHRRASTLYGYELPVTVEDAIFQQRWDVVRGWAVTTALKHGDAGLVRCVNALIFAVSADVFVSLELPLTMSYNA